MGTGWEVVMDCWLQEGQAPRSLGFRVCSAYRRSQQMVLLEGGSVEGQRPVPRVPG